MTRHSLLLLMGLWLLLLWTQTIEVQSLAFERDRIMHGQYWRLVTAHFIHLNSMHLLLNMLGVALVLLIFDVVLSVWQSLAIMMVSALIISIMIYYCSPHVVAYVGLSGVIHALYTVGTIQLLANTKERYFAIILVLSLTLKLLTENLGQGISLTADIIGGRVLFQSHLYGALAGVFLGLIVLGLPTQKRNNNDIKQQYR